MTMQPVPAPGTSRPSSARSRALRTFALLLLAVLLLAVGADMAGVENAASIGWGVGLVVGAIGAVLAYRGVIH